MEIKEIRIEVIPHDKQRYNTVGDWFFEPTGDQSLLIRVSETGNWKWNMCIAVHELVEAIMCTANNVTQEQVDVFDKDWKPNYGFQEPGDDPKAPYYGEHQTAMYIEHQLFDFMVDDREEPDLWDSYETKLEELMKSRE